MVLYSGYIGPITHFDSEDDYCTGWRNISHCQQQQSYSGLRSKDDQTEAIFERTPGFKPSTIISAFETN